MREERGGEVQAKGGLRKRAKKGAQIMENKAKHIIKKKETTMSMSLDVLNSVCVTF